MIINRRTNLVYEEFNQNKIWKGTILLIYFYHITNGRIIYTYNNCWASCEDDAGFLPLIFDIKL